jgi:peptidoglycan/LPS O-acetylase OafA/YrhL
VLAVTAVLAFALYPQRNWPQVFQEIAASTAYVENWLLSADSVDYLAQNINVESPVTHFWSLSVEEQFYLVWPLLLTIAWLIASKVIASRNDLGGRRAVLVTVLGVVFAASLALSIAETAWTPGQAYFMTQTRAWEFAAGGLVAVALSRPVFSTRLRSLLSWAGLAMIVAASVFYTGAVPFPGWTALLPVAGTAAVIAAGSPESRWAPTKLFSFRPVQYLGDISYSLYLWHWPLIVFAVVAFDRPGPLGHLLIAVIAIILAALTKRFVEDPVRDQRRFNVRPRTTLLVTAAAMSVVLVVSGGAAVAATVRIDADKAAAATALDSDACLGAGSLTTPGCADIVWKGGLIPGTAAALTDDVNSIACWSRNGDDRVKVCSEGPKHGAALRVALVGDSHSNQYLATLKALAAHNRWHFDVYGKTGCFWSTVEIENTPEWTQNCDSWRTSLDRRLASLPPYDVIITSYAATTPIVATTGKTMQQSVIDGFVDVWKPLAERGTKIVAIRDNPRPRADYLACIDAHPSDSATACARDESNALHFFDGQPAAVKLVPNASLLDLTPYFCREQTCDPVIGHVIVYRDQNHLTSSYTRTLAPYLREGVLKLTGLKEKPAA